ncbi:UNVERIFIED_ORG: hypothetical protein EDF86_2821 [Pseudomonas psychrophila]
MKDSNKAWQVSAILCLACALIVPFNLLELYARFKLGIELYAYIIATPAVIVSVFLVQLAAAISLYRKLWTSVHSVCLSVWLINMSILLVLIWRTIPENTV